MSTRLARSLVLCGILVTSLAAAQARSDAPAGVDSAWQHRHAKFDYNGHTTLFTCTGLEGQVSQILRYLGARKDIRVHAGGCMGSDLPTRLAWVDVDFYTLAPAADPAGGELVKAQWSAAQLTPQHPPFSSEGICELFESMKDVILKNFSVREFAYRTDCVPHTLSPNGFDIKGDVLKQIVVKAS